MPNFVCLICQNDGYVDRVGIDDVEPIEVGRIIESVILPMRSGASIVNLSPRRPGWRAAGEIHSKKAVFAVLLENEPVADIVICLHSRAAPALWSQFADSAPDDLEVVDTIYPEHPPWAAVRWRYQPQEWLERWVMVLAYTLATETDEQRRAMYPSRHKII